MTDVNPTIPLTPAVTRGELIRLPRGEYGEEAQTLAFQYNPEQITRSRRGRWETNRPDRPPSTPADRVRRGGQGSAGLMADSETIELRAIFDATDSLAGPTPPAESPTAAAVDPMASVRATEGILAELAFLELVSVGREVEQRRGRPASTQLRPIKPDELLLKLGTARTFPVVMTSLRITEQKFRPDLVPIRAEVNLEFTVLESHQSLYSRLITETFEQLLEKRRSASEQVRPRTAAEVITASAPAAGAGAPVGGGTA